MRSYDYDLFRSLFCLVDDAYGVMTDDRIFTIREKLTDEIIRDHLYGRKRIGTMFIDPDDRSDQLVIDIDEQRIDQATRILQVFEELGIYAYLESSKSKGFHIRSHWDLPFPASELRKIGKYIALRAEIPEAEVFPKQDSRGEGGLGNFMFLPLHGESLKDGKTAILDPENDFKPVPEPWDALAAIKKALRGNEWVNFTRSSP